MIMKLHTLYLLGCGIGICMSIIFCFNLLGIVKIHGIYLHGLAEKTSFNIDCGQTQHRPTLWIAFGCRLADMCNLQHKHWHLTSSEHMKVL
jgi:hypothetical protein